MKGGNTQIHTYVYIYFINVRWGMSLIDFGDMLFFMGFVRA